MSDVDWKYKDLKSKIEDSEKYIPDIEFLDEETVDLLWSFHSNYEQKYPWEPTSAEKTTKWQKITKRFSSIGASKAISQGKDRQVATAVGHEDKQSGYSPYREYEMLRNVLLDDTVNSLIYAGSMGSGKTADALRISEFLSVISQTRDESVLVMTNIKSVTENHENYFYVLKLYDVLDIMASQPADRYVLILDEASTFLTGYGKHLRDISEFGSFVRRARKFGLLGIYIGHRTSDISPNIRDLAGTHMIYKGSKQKAKVFKEFPEDPDRADPLVDLRGLNDTYLDYNTEGFAPWSFEGIDLWQKVVSEEGVTSPDDFRDRYMEIRKEELKEDLTSGFGDDDELSEEEIQEKIDEKIQEIIIDRAEKSYQGQRCRGRNKDGSRCDVKHGLTANTLTNDENHLKAYGLCERHLGDGKYEEKINQHELTDEYNMDPYEFAEDEWNKLLDEAGYGDRTTVDDTDDINIKEDRCIGRTENGNRCTVTEDIGENNYCSEHREQYFYLRDFYDGDHEVEPHELPTDKWEEISE